MTRTIHGGRHQVKERKMGEMNSPSGERLTWKGTGHVASDSEWMMRRRENHVDQRGEVNG
jgi:hypothetical protein